MPNATHADQIRTSQRVKLLGGLVALNVVVLSVLPVLVPAEASWDPTAYLTPVTAARIPALGRYGLLLLCLLTVELLAIGWRASSIRRLTVRPSPSARSDLVIASLLVLGYGTGLAAVATGFASTLVPKWIARSSLALAIPDVQPAWLRWVLWFLVADLVKYGYHRALHTVQFMWQAHKVHHAATEFTVLTGNRIHPLEHAGLFLVLSLPLLVTGAPPSALLAVYALQRVIDWLQHSPVLWDFGWVGQWVVFSPVGHRIHHSPLEEHWDTNFGDFLVIWDRLFGTWYDGPIVNEELGLSTGQWSESGPLEQLVDAAVLSYRDLATSLRTQSWAATHVVEARTAAESHGWVPPTPPVVR